LFASVWHRAWFEALEAYLDGESGLQPPLDPTMCDFGRWLQKEGQIHYGDQASFQAIQRLHVTLHQQAAWLCQQHADDRDAPSVRDESPAKRDELREAHAQLLDELKGLIQSAPVDSGIRIERRHPATPKASDSARDNPRQRIASAYNAC